MSCYGSTKRSGRYQLIKRISSRSLIGPAYCRSASYPRTAATDGVTGGGGGGGEKGHPAQKNLALDAATVVTGAGKAGLASWVNVVPGADRKTVEFPVSPPTVRRLVAPAMVANPRIMLAAVTAVLIVVVLIVLSFPVYRL